MYFNLVSASGQKLEMGIFLSQVICKTFLLTSIFLAVFPGACTPLHYFMSVANRIQTQLCNIVDNDCLFEKILRAVDTNNKADETRQEYDIDIEQYISDIVDDDEEIEVRIEEGTQIYFFVLFPQGLVWGSIKNTPN